MQSWGFNPEDPSCVVLNPATKVYCDFLLATAGQEELNAHQNEHSMGFEGKTAQIIAAMTPCMRLYAFLGQEIKRYVEQVRDHPYQQWIDVYSSPDFEVFLSYFTHGKCGSSNRICHLCLCSCEHILVFRFSLLNVDKASRQEI